MSLPNGRQRFRARSVLAIVCIAMAGGACADTPVGGPPGEVPVAIRPVFSSAAYAVGLSIDEMHIVITEPPAKAALVDTTLRVAPGADSVAVSLKIRLTANKERLTAGIDLLSGGAVVYHGSTNLTVTAGQTGGVTPSVTVGYVGPGASATRVVVSPADTAIPATAVLPFQADVRDGGGQSIAGVPVHWSLLAGSQGAIDANTGVYTGDGHRGTARVVAEIPTGLADTARLFLRAAATKLAVVSGDQQKAPAGSSLPQAVVIEADGADGAVAGVTVRFDAGTTGGSIAPDSAVTDSSGRASAHVTLGPAHGAQKFEASAGGLGSAAILEIATAAPASALAIVSGDAQVDSVGTTLAPFVVLVSDAFGNPVAGATVDWSVVTGDGTLSDTSTATDSSGQASVTYTLGRKRHEDIVRASLAGTHESVDFKAQIIGRRTSTLVVVSGDKQHGVVAQVLPDSFVVRATDALGDPVEGDTVRFVVAGGGNGAVAPATAVTDSAGNAATSLTLGTHAGSNVYSATVGTAVVTVREIGTPGTVADLTMISGDNQSDSACVTLKNPFVVQATDPFGNGVAGATVDWTEGAGRGVKSLASAPTDSLGNAGLTYQLGTTAGVDTVTATLKANVNASVNFVVTVENSVKGACKSGNALRATDRKGRGR